MATTLYMTSAVATATSTFTTTTNNVLAFARGSGVVTQTDNSVASLVTAANPQTTGAVSPVLRAASVTLAAAGTVEADATIGASLFWISPHLTAATVSGTITANLRASESAAQANYAIGCKLYKIAGNAVTAAFAQGSNVTELGTSDAATSISLTPTSTQFGHGDQLGVLVFYLSPSGSTSASGRTAAFTYAGVSAAASGDSFLTFTESITLFTVAPAPVHLPFV